MNKTDIYFLERLVYEAFLLQKCNIYLENTETLAKESKKFSLPLILHVRKSRDESTETLNRIQDISCHSPVLKQLPSQNTHDCLKMHVQHHNRIMSVSTDCTPKGKAMTLTNTFDISNVELECLNKVKEEKKLWECPVCLEQSKGQEIVATVCGHVFCRGCILECLRQSKNSQCPSCRFTLGTCDFITLYNI